MKNIKDIAVILRGRNESKWLIKCIDSIKKQIKVSYEIFYIDNNSDDNSLLIASIMGANVIQFKDEYFPGKMINFGINFAKSKGEFSSFLIMSSHCVVNEINAFSNLFNSLDKKNRIRSSFGRQLPAHFSSLMAVRDLVELYPPYASAEGFSTRLNNAFSLISKDSLNETMFDESISNIEDFLWSIQEIEKGYLIKYVPEASVIHHHGPHHDQSELRLKNTAKSINLNSDKFGFVKKDIPIENKSILVIFSSNKNKDDIDISLINNIKNWTKTNKLDFKFLSNSSENNYRNKSLKEKIRNYLVKNSLLNIKYEFLLIFDTNFDLDLGFPPLKSYLDCINHCFPTSIIPVEKSFAQIYKSIDQTLRRIDHGDLAIQNNPGVFIGKRGNGWMAHLSYFLNKNEEENVAILYKENEKWRYKHAY